MNLIKTVGFTGTSKRKMTGNQHMRVYSLLIDLWRDGYRRAAHGDCINCDEEFHHMAKSIGFEMSGHPPLNQSKEAHCQFDIVWPRKPYLDRNRDVVDESDVMIATPFEATEQLRSGTWATVRYSRKKGKQVHLILP